MNNNTFDTAVDCGYSPAFWEACKMVTYITYTLAPPICLIVGLPSHLVALIAFLKHRNADAGYSFQILTTLTKVLEILAMFMFSLFFIHGAGQDWTGAGPGDGPDWFMTSYSMMWFTAHVPPTLAAAATDIAVFASAATAADRAFALTMPFVYQKINHKRHFAVAAAACILVPLIGELHVCFMFELISAEANSSKYLVQYAEFAMSSVGANWATIMAVVRSLGEATLILCSVVMIYKFKQRNQKVQQLGSLDVNKEAKRKANERTLFFLALYQCTATTLPAFLITAWDVTNYFSASFVYCGGTMLSPVTDLLLQLVNSIDVYFMVCVSSSFRQMVTSILRRNPNGDGGGMNKNSSHSGQSARSSRAAAAWK